MSHDPMLGNEERHDGAAVGVTYDWIILGISDHWAVILDADAGFFTSEMITSPCAEDAGIVYPSSLEPGVYLMKNIVIDETVAMYTLDSKAGFVNIYGTFHLLCSGTLWTFAGKADFNLQPEAGKTMPDRKTQ